MLVRKLFISYSFIFTFGVSSIENASSAKGEDAQCLSVRTLLSETFKKDDNIPIATADPSAITAIQASDFEAAYKRFVLSRDDDSIIALNALKKLLSHFRSHNPGGKFSRVELLAALPLGEQTGVLSKEQLIRAYAALDDHHNLARIYRIHGNFDELEKIRSAVQNQKKSAKNGFDTTQTAVVLDSKGRSIRLTRTLNDFEGQNLKVIFNNGDEMSQKIDRQSARPAQLRKLFSSMKTLAQFDSTDPRRQIEVAAFVFEMKDGTFRTFRHTSRKFDHVLPQDANRWQELGWLEKGIEPTRVKKVYHVHTHPKAIDFQEGSDLREASIFTMSHADLGFNQDLPHTWSRIFDGSENHVEYEFLVLPNCEGCNDTLISWSPELIRNHILDK